MKVKNCPSIFTAIYSILIPVLDNCFPQGHVFGCGWHTCVVYRIVYVGEHGTNYKI